MDLQRSLASRIVPRLRSDRFSTAQRVVRWGKARALALGIVGKRLACRGMFVVLVALLGASVATGRGRSTVIRTSNNRSLGWIVVAPTRQTLYVFCSGASSWCKGDPPSGRFRPLIARGGVAAARGSQIRSSKLGTKKLSTGERQVTYYGQPLFRDKDDRKPGQTRGEAKTQGSGIWFAIGPDGQPRFPEG